MTGAEPALSAWKADGLPLTYIRINTVDGSRTRNDVHISDLARSATHTGILLITLNNAESQSGHDFRLL